MKTQSVFDYGYYVEENWQANEGVGNFEVGENQWDIDILSSGADTLSYETAQGESFLRMTGAASGSGDGTSLALDADSITVGTGGGYIKTRIRIPDISNNTLADHNFTIGITDVITSGTPAVGLWVGSVAGVMSFYSASANGSVTTAFNAKGLTSGTTLVKGTIYNIELRWSGNNGNSDPGPDTLQCFINGQPAAEKQQVGDVVLDGAETMEAKIVHWATTSSTLELDVFGYECASFLAK